MSNNKRFELDDSNEKLLPENSETSPRSTERDAIEEHVPDAHKENDIPAQPDLPADASPAEIGLYIAQRLDYHRYHPVIIFGSSNSGKSSLLSSLFAYLDIESTKAIGLSLGSPILSTATPYGQSSYQEAESFFFKGVQEFINGTANPVTTTDIPFFIPVVVAPHGGKEQKLAFLESRGEWYKPKRSTGKFFAELKDEINSVLLNYPRGISFIYVAPYTQVSVWSTKTVDANKNSEEIKDADSALVGAIKAYREVRPVKKDDRHIFLMTKWDAYSKRENGRSIEDILDHEESRYFCESLF